MANNEMGFKRNRKKKNTYPAMGQKCQKKNRCKSDQTILLLTIHSIHITHIRNVVRYLRQTTKQPNLQYLSEELPSLCKRLLRNS